VAGLSYVRLAGLSATFVFVTTILRWRDVEQLGGFGNGGPLVRRLYGAEAGLSCRGNRRASGALFSPTL
jgi:hypothetical protein